MSAFMLNLICMKHLLLNFNNKEEYDNVLKEAAETLKNGGIIIYPTDTLYGLGANALDKSAILRIFKIKKQSSTKPISVIAKDISMARRISCIDKRVENILRKVWPGPITIILRKKDIVPYVLTAESETIGIRIPHSIFINDLMKLVDFPITATSANISGKNDLLNPKEIIEIFGKESSSADMFVDSGKIKNPEPSTIIDLTTNTPKIVRIGVVGRDKMMELFNKFIQ